MHVCWNIQSGLQDALIFLQSATMKQPAMACSCSNDSDIRKKGFLLKIKTSKKKLFVLREESSSGPARLEYYDSEKKLRAGGLARRCVLLKNCFSINAKTDGSRHRHAIVLYTKDDCFGIACESEAEQQAWLREMIELRQMSLDNMTQKRPILKHVWPVSVEAVDGKCTLIAPGPYRLCLTVTNLTLIPLTSGLNEIVVPLDSIRCCGHGECLFLIEVDRSSMVDAGELWLKTDDSVVAQCMHDTLVDLLASFSESRNPFRARAYTSIAAIGSGATVDARRAVIMRSKMRRPVVVRNSAVVDSTAARDSTWSESLEQQIKDGKTPGMNYFVMKPGQDSDAVPSDSGYIEMKPPRKDAYIDMCPGRCRSDARSRQNRQTFHEEVAAYSLNSLPSRAAKSKSGYMEMAPGAFPTQDATSMLASRLSAVRSYVHEGSGESDEEDSDDSAGRTSIDSLPKERAYSVGSKPAVHSRIRFLGHRIGNTEAPSEINGNVPEETAVGISDVVAAPVDGKLSSREDDYMDLAPANTAARQDANGMKRRISAAEILARQIRDVDLNAEEGLRPRTSTFPWDLLRSTDPAYSTDDPLRPRSSSGSNPAQVREAL